MTRGYRLLLKWARNIHLYTTLFGLVLLMFFAVTGFMLNHENWFVPLDPFTRDTTLILPKEILEQPQELAIVEALRKHGATGALNTFSTDSTELEVIFKSPGREVTAKIDRSTGEANMSFKVRGSVALFLDLHRGKDSGLPWSFIIDGTCVIMIVVAATGMILWWSLRGRGHLGLITILAGLAISTLVYLLWVP